MVDSPTIRAVTSLSGQKYVIVGQDDISVPVPLGVFTGTNPSIAGHLRTRGIHLIGAEMTVKLVKNVALQCVFREANLADHVGWNGAHFVLPDGSSVSPAKSDALIVAIDPTEGKCAQAGSLKAWKRGVAKPLAEQSLAKFMLMLPFMPPLLKLTSRSDNFGFELVGKKGVGKSTLQYLAASVVGSPVRGDNPPYWSTWDTTLNALEDVMPVHSDLLMINEEAALFFADESKGKRASLFKAFAFKAAAGSTKNRLGGKAPGAGSRFSYLSSSNSSLMELLGDNSEISSAAADRLITINIPPDRPHGAFDFVPDGYESGSAFATAVMQAAIENHGLAFRHYLHGLVDHRAADEAELRAIIQQYVAQFRSVAEVDLNDGSAVRVADGFGLVFAAGRLAVQFGALPRRFDCGPAVLACYRLHKAGSTHQSFEERLEQIAGDPETALLEHGDRGLPAKRLHGVRAILERKGARRRLIILPAYIERYFPDWNSLRRRPEVAELLQRETDHLQIKVQTSRKGPPQRAFVFKLKPEEPPTPDDSD